MKIAPGALLAAALLLQAASFEVATIKPANPDPSGSSGEDGRNGTLKVYNVTLKRCIRYAYGISETQILDGPKWVDDLRYDIVAKADHSADEPELLTMLQPLLADRFKLVLHHESRPIAGYVLIAAKGGIRAKVSDPNGRTGANGARGRMDVAGGHMSLLATRLSAVLGRPLST